MSRATRRAWDTEAACQRKRDEWDFVIGSITKTLLALYLAGLFLSWGLR